MPKQKHKGMTILAIGSIPLILVLGNSMLIPILPKMKTELNLTQFQTSLIISVFSISAAVMIPILGYLSDRFSRKAIVIPALILYGSGGILAGAAAAWFSNAYTWILAGRIMQGIGAAGTTSMAMALTGDLFKGGEQSKVLGLVEASNGFGKVVSPIIGSLLALLFWYAAFFAFPIFCLASIYGSVRFLGVAIGPPVYGALMAWSRTGMFLSTAGLTLLVGILCLVFIHISKKEPSKEKDTDTLFEKLQFT